MAGYDFDAKFPTALGPGNRRIAGAVIFQKDEHDKDVPITLSGNMVRNSSGLWVPVSDDDPLPVKGEMQLSGTTVDMATETTLAQSVDKLNSILSRLEGKLDTAIFDSQGNPISAANRLPVEATLSGQTEVVPLIASETTIARGATWTGPEQEVGQWTDVAYNLRLGTTSDVLVRVEFRVANVYTGEIVLHDGPMVYSAWKTFLASGPNYRLSVVNKEERDIILRYAYERRFR